MPSAVATIGLIACLATASGCVDGPLYAMKRVNPYYTSQWKKDREYGPTYEDRKTELVYVQNRLPSMEPAEQAEWADRLATLAQKDVSAEMRAQAIKAIGKLDSPAVTQALNAASSDDVEKVRLAACAAWQQHGGSAAIDMLSSIAMRKDETTSVRQAAIASLAAVDDADAIDTLGRLIDDPSPAIQFQVAQSLGEITGEQHGGDFAAWKQYLASRAPAETSNSLGEKIPEVNFAGSQQPLSTDPPSLAREDLPAFPQFR
ncbi:MAG: HEAT repeat domain-containing protein [Aureliella sp.]